MSSDRAWLSSLDPTVDRQRDAIGVLLGWCEADPLVSSLSVGCSIGRGAADELSDVDAAVGVTTTRGASGTMEVERVEQSLVDLLSSVGDVVDMMRGGSTSTELVVRNVFVQFADRLQLDVAVIAEAEVRRGDAAPDFVAVYHQDAGARVVSASPSAYEVSAEQVQAWVFLGWRALLDADKYLRRGSLWEAHHRLNESRDHIWRLWAAARGASYPRHGLSQVLDESPDDLPPGIEATVAGLDAALLREAVSAAAGVLESCVVAVTAARGFEASPNMARYARKRLAET